MWRYLGGVRFRSRWRREGDSARTESSKQLSRCDSSNRRGVSCGRGRVSGAPRLRRSRCLTAVPKYPAGLSPKKPKSRCRSRGTDTDSGNALCRPDARRRPRFQSSAANLCTPIPAMSIGILPARTSTATCHGAPFFRSHYQLMSRPRHLLISRHLCQLPSSPLRFRFPKPGTHASLRASNGTVTVVPPDSQPSHTNENAIQIPLHADRRTRFGEHFPDRLCHHGRGHAGGRSRL